MRVSLGMHDLCEPLISPPFVCPGLLFFSLTVCLRSFKNLEVLCVLASILFPVLISWIPFTNDLNGTDGPELGAG